LEAALITSIILAYLSRVKRNPLSKFVWIGVCLSISASLGVGSLIWLLYGTLAGEAQVLFEGLTAIFAVIVLTTMIYWMASKGRKLNVEIEKRVAKAATHGEALGIISFSFVIVFREGLETVLFLTPFLFNDVFGTLIGAVLGVLASLVLSYMIFLAGRKINLRFFFYFTSILLILLAAGLAGYGIHELIEYSETKEIKLGWLAQPAYNLNIPEDSLFHHKNVIGGILAVMFGYTVSAEWLRVIVHAAYLTVTLPLTLYIYRKQRPKKL